MTNPTEYLVDPELTANEQAVLDADAAEVQAAADAEKAAAAPTPDPEPEPAAPDPVATALAENTAANRALAETIAADRAAREAADAARNQPPAEQPRDFDAELNAAEAAMAASEQQYEDGDIDKAAFDAAKADFRRSEREIVREQAKAEALAVVAEREKANAEKAAADAEAKAESDWKAAQTKFFADPGNAALVGDPIKKAAFVAAVEMAGSEGYADFEELLVNARTKVTGIAPVDTDKTIRDAKFDRQKDAGNVPAQTLRDVPNAANPGDQPGASLDNLPIDQLEDALARMSAADRDRYLANAPGGLNDNPRAAG